MYLFFIVEVGVGHPCSLTHVINYLHMWVPWIYQSKEGISNKWKKVALVN